MIVSKHSYGRLRDEVLIEHLQFVSDLFLGDKNKIAEHLDISERNLRNIMDHDRVIKAPKNLKYGTELWLVERELIERIHREADCNNQKTSRLVGISPRTLFYKLRDYRKYDAGIK